jgi:hypothetical protein
VRTGANYGAGVRPLPLHKFEEFFSLRPNLLKTFQKNVNTQTLSCGNTYHFAATFVDLLQAARKLLVRH